MENFALQLEDCREVYLHKLFIGHPGCGKTTELYQLLQRVKKADFFICMGRCDLELDLVDIEYTDILFFFLDLLVRRASELGMELDENLVEDIYAYWEEEIEMTEAVSVQAQTEIHSSAKAKAGLWNNLGAVYICMRQNERAADCFAKAADIWPKDAGGGILRGEELEKLGMLLEEEGDFPAAYKCISQAKDIRLNIEIDRRDEKHLQKLNERMSAYAARIKKIQEEKGRHGKKDIGYRGE